MKTDWTISIKSTMDVVDHVDVVAPDHARVVLSKPSNGWLFSLTSRLGAMFSPTGVADLANKPVGTGPYVVAARKRGDSVVLKANPAYWGRKPAYRTVVLKYIKDPTALNNALLQQRHRRHLRDHRAGLDPAVPGRRPVPGRPGHDRTARSRWR